MHEVFMSRQPLVNRQSKIIATRLRFYLGATGNMLDATSALTNLEDVWPKSEKPLFLSFGGARCGAQLLDWNAPENAVIELHGDDLVGAGGADLVTALQTWQPTTCLQIDRQAMQALATGLSFRFIGFDTKALGLPQIKLLAARTRSHGMGIAFNVDAVDEFQACMDAGIAAAASWFFTRPSGAYAKALNPGQTNIIRLLNLVRNNADVREIEAALKQDVAISYKLLRYINSASLGLSCEIQSFRHAVTMLGYNKLNRWLSLLLSTASKDPMAPAMMHTAMVRARLMELLAQGLVDKSEYDNLFITGAFSLLNVLFGVPTEQIVEAMRLPDAICDALLGNGGRYQPFLDLARASEMDDGAPIAEQTAMLGLTADQFNRLQLQALSFAELIEF